MQDNLLIFQPSGVLDGSTMNDLRNNIRNAMSTGQETILIDMQDVNFMNSAGIGALVATLKDVKQKGGKLFLCDLTAQVQVIFQLTKMERVFKPFKDRDDFEEKVLQQS